ncbi:tetratricopeptide repeat protein [Saccharothrix sp. NRRL B-16348]|uniref:tetratricopeptide repeat protein n=1 Tax=Saccharothrix sp. NRRL B-16348 TaxID=1415542 RepID=UPI0006AFE657|nr:tetratricopeptide repeat protein [Saccharothrix sp. NRRL B-16348]
MGLRAALAFGRPLRDGLELVRGQSHLGTIVVLGCGPCHESQLDGGDVVDRALTDEAILRAARDDNATVLDAGLGRIVRKNTELRTSLSTRASGGGTRHKNGERFSVETGHPVAVVSEERQTITVFHGERKYLLRTRDELRDEIRDLMAGLRSALSRRERQASGEDRLRAVLAEVGEHLVELGAPGRALHTECALIAAELGVEWEVPADLGTSTFTAPDGPTAAERRLRALSDRLAVELDLSSSREFEGDHRLSTGLYVRRTQQDAVRDLLAPAGYDKPVLVSGVPGEGKSSLLWGLHEDLRDDPVLVPYLLNSPWLTGSRGAPALLGVDDLRATAESARGRGRVAVFLVDTVDLLLHDEAHRRQVLDLCDALAEAGGQVVLTSRPEEAQSLPKASFRGVVLRPYDDAELPVAVAKHVAAFCPDSAAGGPAEQVAAIVDSAARGLTVREVVLNPLKLRLLFELYQPDFPSLEHDVSSLYRMYWERRVHTDRRGETGLDDGADLTEVAENTAIALLAAGRTELGEPPLRRSAATVAAGRRRAERDAAAVTAEIAEGITGLARRGVLVRSEQAVRFFHQTMFEYAAAVGLLDRDGDAALTFLVDHLKARPDDLFVGAVVEQALILALDDPVVSPAAVSLLEGIATDGTPALQRIALGVLAHKPSLQATTERLVDAVDEAALRRYAQTVPTVLKADVGHQVDMLVKVWQRSVGARESVLLSLERLGARDPAVVVSALRELDCVTVALSWKDSPARMVQLVARVLVVAAKADPEWARAQLLALLDAMLARNTHRTLPLHLLDVLADHWARLGSPDTATAVEARVLRAQEDHDAAAGEVRRALGRIIALDWRDRLTAGEAADQWWPAFVEDLCERLDADYYSVLANAQLHAISHLVKWDVLDAARAVWTVERLAAVPGYGAFALAHSLFAPLLAADGTGSAAAAVEPFLLGLLDGLPAPGHQPAAGPQRLAHVVRQALHDADLPAARLAALLADVPAAREAPNWLSDEHLAVLLVPAAVGGHPVAGEAFELVAADPGVLSETGLKTAGYDAVRHLGADPRLLPLLIEQSVRRTSAAPFSEVVDDLTGGLLDELRAHSARLTHLVDLLFGGGGAAQRDAASLWRRLHQVGAVPEPEHEELVARFRATPAQAARGNILDLAVDVALRNPARLDATDRLLRDLFRVDAGAVVSARDGEPGHVAVIARAAWLRLTCVGRPTAEVDAREVVATAAAAPTTTDNLAVLGYLISRLAGQGAPRAAADLLLGVTGVVRDVPLQPKQENRLANKLRTPIRMIMRAARPGLQRELLAQAPTMPQTHARLLVTAAAQENFAALRENLAALLDEDLPYGVAQQIHDDIRIRSRAAASGSLPGLLEPLPRTVPAPEEAPVPGEATVPAPGEAVAAPTVQAGGPSSHNDFSGVAHTVVQAGSIGSVVIAAEAPAPPPVPRQLPMAPRGFVNQVHALARLSQVLTPDAPPVHCVVGLPGVGKTAVVVHWAHLNEHHFPDGVLFADLRGFHPAGSPAEPGEVLDAFLTALGLSGRASGNTLDSRAAVYRTALRDRRMLVVLDDAVTADQVRPLLPGGRSVVLVTSRSALRGLVVREGAAVIDLDPLPPDEAVSLLVRDGGAEPADTATADLARWCGYLPLALRIAAERLASGYYATTAEFVAELTREADVLDLFDTDDDASALRSVFSVSYRHLAPEPARVFRFLGLFAGTTIGVEAAGVLSGLGTGKARRALDALRQANLLELVRPGHYRMHDLLRHFAAERVRQEEDDAVRRDAVRAVLTWYLVSAANADAVLDAANPEVPAVPGTGAEFADVPQATAWFAAEQVNLVACVRQAAGLGEHDLAWRLAATLFEFFYRTKAWEDWIDTHVTGLASATADGDRHGVANLLGRLAVAHRERRDHESAEERFREAMAIWTDLDDDRGLAWVASRYAQACRERGRHDEAVDLCLRALAAAERTGDRQEAGVIHNNLSGIHREAGRLDDALRHSDYAIAEFEAVEYRRGLAWARTNAANVHRDARRFDTALDLYRLAHDERARLGDHYGRALTLSDMGYAQCLSGDVDTGLTTLHSALTLFPPDDPALDRVRARIAEFDPDGERTALPG